MRSGAWVVVGFAAMGIALLAQRYMFERSRRIDEERRRARTLAAAGERAIATRVEGRIRVAGAPFDGILTVEVSKARGIAYFEIEGFEPGQYARTPDIPLELLASDDHELVTVGWSL